MISYVTIGTNDLEGTAKFYDAVLGVLGASRKYETETFIAWAAKSGGPMISLNKPYDGNPASAGNGMMVALTAESPAMVDAVHKKALELGATDEGAPGPRGGGYYGYFRDPDGNKLCAAYLG
ncbi:MAG: VOC family protein [Proteobacteria bacterium]|nr:VOC family protein [Pseudomonadota bacterium]